MVRQNILISNCNKSNVYNLSNDIFMNFPISLFFKQPRTIELANFDLNAEFSVFGNTNNTLLIQYKDESYIIVVEYDETIKTDYKLAIAIQFALNNPRELDNINNKTIYNGSKWQSIVWANSLNLYVAVSISGDGNRVMYSSDTINWTYSNHVPANKWTSICWSSELNLFVAVSKTGYLNRIMVSSDGINWTVKLAPNDNDWESVCWSPLLNLFVAVSSTGDTNRVMTSSDGLIWVIQKSANSNNWTSVCWSSTLNIFVAIANSGLFNRIMTSSNGINWTTRTSPNNNNWSSVISSTISNLIVAVSNNGDTNRVMISNDGINWTAIQSAGANEWNSVIWCNYLNKFIAVASSGNGNQIMTSTNGIEWSIQISPDDIKWMTLACSNTEIIALAASGTSNRIMKSIDSINWSLLSDASNFNWQSICWSNTLNLFVAVANSGNIIYKSDDVGYIINSRIMTSIDGKIWVASKLELFNNWSSICWAGSINKYIAVANSGNLDRVITSIDGLSWIVQTAASDNNWTSICWSDNLNLGVAVSNSGTNNRIMTTNNGINWTSQISPADNNWTSVCRGRIDVGLLTEKEIFVAVSNSGTNRVMISYDGINWILQLASVNNNWSSICWSPLLNLFVAVASSGNNNRIMSSSDGINWTTQVSPVDNDWTSICWSTYINKFIVVSSTGNNNRVIISSNGINWSIQSTPTNYEWSSVTYSNNYIVAVSKSGEGNRVMISTDGISWENYDSLQPMDLVFTTSESSIEHVLTTFKIERESATSSFSISTTNPCTISFNHKDSIGPIIGFGHGIYENVTKIDGISTQSISSYHYIDIYNESGSTIPAIFPNYNDINCKMALFDSNGQYIPNATNPNDLSISLNSILGLKQYNNIGEVLKLIEIQMNQYKTIFYPEADFVLEFDYNSNKIIITNYTGATFGFGFDFENMKIPNSGNTSGSLHAILGFKKKSYLNVVSIISDYESQTFENVFADDYLLICSSITTGASDLNIIGIGNGDNVKNNNALFAIPLQKVSHFEPANSLFYNVDISNSPFSLGYKYKTFSDTNPNLVNFYLRLLSGRHIAANSNYTMLLSFEF